jgi:hypothetical protein
MRPLLRICIAGLALCAALLTLSTSLPTDGHSQLETDSQLLLIRRLTSERNEVVDNLTAGRLSFLEAARRFRDLNDGDPVDDLAGLRSTFPGASDDELYCRQVLCYVAGRRPELDPDGKLLGRLARELDERAEAGTLSLSE